LFLADGPYEPSNKHEYTRILGFRTALMMRQASGLVPVQARARRMAANVCL
jgi:hypothetical protein